MTNTILVDLDVGTCILQIEQRADLEALVGSSIISHTTAPYWAYLWPSARALARFIGERSELNGARFLDLGCGLGPLGIAAASRGARVTVADLQPEAIELAVKNAARNGLNVTGCVLDWNQIPDDFGTFDHIAAADVFYEDGMLRSVLRVIKKHLEPGGTAWVADPMRVMPGGVEGAGRLNGLEISSTVLVEGQTMTGGVTLFEIKKRARGGASTSIRR